jgi:hypothetical protein
MTLVEFLSSELRRLHGLMDRGVADLTPDQWHAVPTESPEANTIAFVVWHYVRTEDNVVRFILQNRRPTVWMEGGWAERLGLPPVAQGTGMPAAEAQALRIPDLDAFKQYMQQVWRSTEEYLSSPDESTFDRPVTVKPLGEMPAIRALGQVCVSHGFTHLGGLDLSRTLLGLPAVINV